jgi:hypothetical protein
MWDVYQRKMNRVFIAREASWLQYQAYFWSMRTHSSALLWEPCIMRQLSRRSSKQSSFSVKGTHKTWRPCSSWHVLQTYQCVSNTSSTQRSIRKKMIRELKIGDSVKQIEGTRCMRLGSNRGVRSMNVDHSIGWSGTEVTRLTTCSKLSDDTTNVYLGHGSNGCDGIRGWT